MESKLVSKTDNAQHFYAALHIMLKKYYYSS